jgi:hypothetical protein
VTTLLDIPEPPEDDGGISPYWAQLAAAFHQENPMIYTLLVKYAREAKNAGLKRIGIELLWNRVRWDRAVQTRTADFKVNQNFKAWYARQMMKNEPDLAGVFETRRRDNKGGAE